MPLDLQGLSISVCCMSHSLGCTACLLLNAWSGRKKNDEKWCQGKKKKSLPHYFDLALCSVCSFANQNGKMWQLWGMWWERQVGVSWEGITSVLGNAAATLISMALRGAKQSLLSHFGEAEAQLLENLPAIAGLWVNGRLLLVWSRLLTCLARRRDLRAWKTPNAQGYFSRCGFWGHNYS